MKPDHIPILSYVFIGVTSLVLTYATIMDTTDEIILLPTNEPESYVGSLIPSLPEAPAIEIPSLTDTIDKIKSLNPFSTEVDSNNVASQSQIPVAVPVNTPSAPPVTGGNRRTKHTKRKQKKSKNTRRTDK